MFGYTGKTLQINLSNRKTEVKVFSENFAREYIGGVGFATRLLYDLVKPGTDPLSPENVLIFATGPVCGTVVPCGYKSTVAAKSPLTGFLGESTTTSFWPQTLKYAGYDALLIIGKAEKPTCVFVDDRHVEFRSAEALSGKSPLETENLLMEELGDNHISVASIGLGGENRVLFANIANDRAPGQGARRTGMGAVMGSKNLKAIAVRGTNSVAVADPSGLMKVSRDLITKAQGQCTEKYRIVGTSANLSVFQNMGILPTRNFQQAQFEGTDAVSGEELLEKYVGKIVACGSCPIACDHFASINEKPYSGVTASVDYESLWALGPNLGIDYMPAIIRAISLCDDYGIDAISTGVTVAWAMECYEKGLLSNTETDGIELKFGSHEALIQVIQKIARREGFGDLLSQGVRRAAEKLGKGSEQFAMHVKGLEMPGYDIRGLKTAAVGWAVAARGGCQSRSGAYDYDISGKVDRLKSERSRGQLAMESEDLATMLDSLAICRFIRKSFDDPYSEAAKIYELVTGMKMTNENLRVSAQNINNLKKAFNMREGWTRKDDMLPPRIMKEPIPDGPSKGAVVREDEFNTMIDGYYEARNWTKDGLIPKKKLTELEKPI